MLVVTGKYGCSAGWRERRIWKVKLEAGGKPSTMVTAGRTRRAFPVDGACRTPDEMGRAPWTEHAGRPGEMGGKISENIIKY